MALHTVEQHIYAFSVHPRANRFGVSYHAPRMIAQLLASLLKVLARFLADIQMIGFQVNDSYTPGLIFSCHVFIIIIIIIIVLIV